MFGSREAGLGRVSSFNRWASVKEGLRRASYPWFEAEFSSIYTSVKERGNFLIVGFPRVARPDVYFEEYWSMGLPWKKDEEGLLTHSLKLHFHRYIGQLQRLPPPHQKTPWRPLFVCKWRHVRTTTKCTPSATIRTSRRTVAVEMTRKASHVLFC